MNNTTSPEQEYDPIPHAWLDGFTKRINQSSKDKPVQIPPEKRPSQKSAPLPQNKPLEKHLTTKHVVRLTGVTERQLQWWDEKGILQPTSITRHKRLYAENQLRDIRRLKQAGDAGVQPSRAKKLLTLEWETAVRIVQPRVIDGVLYVPAGAKHRRKNKGMPYYKRRSTPKTMKAGR